ncbi:BirA family transcriptional regulator, biotin operon repressor / biotin-[acetyl-CoA-carboxylase] ligase [Fibrobacter intestinalis]|uniref:BirA family transcriptional regulator, biotin operon repressor / biotin-[acetyl-CoA-carboxylase] ligase n=1 Tax=Fibrobacter intestinalis TaxID=28122 RepID=A0A1M6WLG2_9BACT|nr:MULTISPECIES: biotin--[acetyl-CoA-carboxylase] ligase [Fibrobacter]PBC68645.1 BirA family biotin operon repressor/biotin-[acetyl-CoA-carboxylase] ligase [Fibrobacter sp. UWS1]SHK94444.1 BirA family transcriptional regulator, biotin operon repressor / biotin-[acetyl-CoA-carboxylase] ligase [Fibrobacter intestinalis]
MKDFFSTEKPFSSWQIQGLHDKPAKLFSSLSSTHRYTKDHLRELNAGDVIVADSQQNGRGRHERTWLSPAGKNLYFNILYPLQGFAPKEYTQLMQITAISIAQLLRHIGIQASVKWPNDILCDRKKFCGMISECLYKNGESLLNIGIGIDVNASEMDFKEIERPVTSLMLLLGEKINREILLQEILQKLKSALETTRVQGIRPWIEEWRKMDQFIGSPARIVEGETTIEGTILDINDDGSLLFCTKSGEILSRYTGDLEI